MTTPDPDAASAGAPEQLPAFDEQLRPVPVHVVPGPRGHGVDLCARQLAEATGARVVGSLGDLTLDPSPTHLHVTDRIWGSSPEDAALRVAVACLARPTTLTLHDLPQAHDGASFERRSHAYAAMARAALGVVVSSQHERGLLEAALAAGRAWVSTGSTGSTDEVDGADAGGRLLVSTSSTDDGGRGLVSTSSTDGVSSTDDGGVTDAGTHIEVVPLPIVAPAAPAAGPSAPAGVPDLSALPGLLDQVPGLPPGLLGRVASRLLGLEERAPEPARDDEPPHPPTGQPDLLRSRICTIGLAGWFYPGKGHLPALGAALAQRRRGHEVDLVVLGAPSPGHEQDAEDLVRRAARLGVRVEITGWLSDDDLAAGLRAVDVPFVGHRNVSASGSLNSWLAAGRRPVVRRSAYFEEMERLRPGTLTLVRTGELAAAVGDALDDPRSTWLEPGTRLGHDVADAAAAYRDFWSRTLRPRPLGRRPVEPGPAGPSADDVRRVERRREDPHPAGRSRG